MAPTTRKTRTTRTTITTTSRPARKKPNRNPILINPIGSALLLGAAVVTGAIALASGCRSNDSISQIERRLNVPTTPGTINNSTTTINNYYGPQGTNSSLVQPINQIFNTPTNTVSTNPPTIFSVPQVPHSHQIIPTYIINIVTNTVTEVITENRTNLYTATNWITKTRKVKVPVSVTNVTELTVTNQHDLTNTVTKFETSVVKRVEKLPNAEKIKLQEQLQNYRTQLNLASNQLSMLAQEGKILLTAHKEMKESYDRQSVALSHTESLLLTSNADLETVRKQAKQFGQSFTNIKTNYEKLLSQLNQAPASSDEQKAVKTIVSKLTFLPGDTIHVEISPEGIATRNKITYPFSTLERTITSISSLTNYANSVRYILTQGEASQATSQSFDRFAKGKITQEYITDMDPNKKIVSGLDILARATELYGSTISQGKPLIFNNPNGVTTIIGPEKVVNALLADKRQAIKYFNGGKK